MAHPLVALLLAGGVFALAARDTQAGTAPEGSGAKPRAELRATPIFTSEDRLTLEVSDDAVLDLHAVLEPLDGSLFSRADQFSEFRNLQADCPWTTYRAENIRSWLPTEPVQVGTVWRIDPESFLPLFRQFHPGAEVRLHFRNWATSGAWACLMHMDERMAEVALRVHAEFRLVEGRPGLSGLQGSVWLMPGRFEGSMRIDRTSGTITSFELKICRAPWNAILQVPRNDEAFGILQDFGTIPRMELIGSCNAEKATVKIDSNEGLSLEQALHLLEKDVYAATATNWLDPADALSKAERTGRPIFVTVFLGNFLDESC